MKNQWWAYLHQNQAIIVKRWYGDVKDYTLDCENNPFVIKVIPPFEADTRDEAISIATEKLDDLYRAEI